MRSCPSQVAVEVVEVEFQVRGGGRPGGDVWHAQGRKTPLMKSRKIWGEREREENDLGRESAN